jgi:hypothetical protein
MKPLLNNGQKLTDRENKMAIPVIAAAAAAARVVGGIMGKGAKSVNPVYKNQWSTEVLKKPSYTPKNSLDTASVSKTVKSKNIKKK